MELAFSVALSTFCKVMSVRLNVFALTVSLNIKYNMPMSMSRLKLTRCGELVSSVKFLTCLVSLIMSLVMGIGNTLTPYSSTINCEV